jgi:Berberine and berberine like
VDTSWSSPADDDRIFTAARNVVNRGVAAANAKGLGHLYLYQNYAAQEQKVFDSYGAKNKERLQHIHQKFDPRGVFTKLQPGYFKIV